MHQSSNSGMGEQALNKAVEIGINSQIEAAESLDVDIHCDPLELTNGEVESMSMRGEGLVMPDNLSVEEIFLETDHIAINLLKAISGKIEFSEPTDASLRVILTEANLNRALKSDYLRNWLCSIPIWAGQQKLNLELREGSFSLASPGKVELTAKCLVHSNDQAQLIDFSVALIFEVGGSQIIFEGGHYLNRQALPLPMTVALLTKANELLSLRSLLVSDLLLQLERIEVETGELKLWLKAHIDKQSSSPRN